MKKIFGDEYLVLVLRLVLGVIFILAGVSKIGDPANFAKSITNYAMMPDFIINIMALTLPWIELIVGIFLMLGIRLKASASLSIAMYIVFTIAITVALLKGLNFNCGCHSKITTENVSLKKIIENIFLLLASFLVFFFPSDKFTLERVAVNEHERTQ
ncbi:MAG: MauE/DoxX family redox-associated membrane protein [Bacteroidota bacterium]